MDLAYNFDLLLAIGRSFDQLCLTLKRFDQSWFDIK